MVPMLPSIIASVDSTSRWLGPGWMIENPPPLLQLGPGGTNEWDKVWGLLVLLGGVGGWLCTETYGDWLVCSWERELL